MEYFSPRLCRALVRLCVVNVFMCKVFGVWSASARACALSQSLRLGLHANERAQIKWIIIDSHETLYYNWLHNEEAHTAHKPRSVSSHKAIADSRNEREHTRNQIKKAQCGMMWWACERDKEKDKQNWVSAHFQQLTKKTEQQKIENRH